MWPCRYVTSFDRNRPLGKEVARDVEFKRKNEEYVKESHLKNPSIGSRDIERSRYERRHGGRRTWYRTWRNSHLGGTLKVIEGPRTRTCENFSDLFTCRRSRARHNLRIAGYRWGADAVRHVCDTILDGKNSYASEIWPHFWVVKSG